MGMSTNFDNSSTSDQSSDEDEEEYVEEVDSTDLSYITFDVDSTASEVESSESNVENSEKAQSSNLFEILGYFCVNKSKKNGALTLVDQKPYYQFDTMDSNQTIKVKRYEVSSIEQYVEPPPEADGVLEDEYTEQTTSSDTGTDEDPNAILKILVKVTITSYYGYIMTNTTEKVVDDILIEEVDDDTGKNYITQNVIRLFDLNRNPIGEPSANYLAVDAFAEYPVGVNADMSYDDYVGMFRKTTLFKLTRNNQNEVVSISNGEYCPCTIEVLPPSDPASENGQIYDRYFSITSHLKASHE